MGCYYIEGEVVSFTLMSLASVEGWNRLTNGSIIGCHSPGFNWVEGNVVHEKTTRSYVSYYFLMISTIAVIMNTFK